MVMMLTAIAEEERKISIIEENRFDNSSGLVEISLTIMPESGIEHISDLEISISQADAILNYEKGLYDSSSGPIEKPPEIIRTGIFSYSVPSLRNGQYLKTKLLASVPKKCGDVIAGRINVVYKGGQDRPIIISVKVPCDKSNDQISITNIIIGLVIVIIIAIVALIIYDRYKKGYFG